MEFKGVLKKMKSQIGDPIHIICYAALPDDEARALKPIIVHVNEMNALVDIVRVEVSKI